MEKEIQFITELLTKTKNLAENSNGNFEVEYEEIKTEISEIDLIKLSEKEFKLMSFVNSDTTQNYISQIIKLKNNSTIEFDKLILTTYLNSIK
jgi:hypothetical protein